MFCFSNPRSLGVHKKLHHPPPAPETPPEEGPSEGEPPGGEPEVAEAPEGQEEISTINVVIERESEGAQHGEGVAESCSGCYWLDCTIYASFQVQIGFIRLIYLPLSIKQT